MISRAERNAFIKNEPMFDDITCSLMATAKQPRGIIKETKDVIAIARKFNQDVVRPRALELDIKMHEDDAYLPWEYVKIAHEWGFYTMFIPKIFGGKGYNMSCVGYFLEEIGSQCLAIANLIGVHYLGVAMLISSWNMRLIEKVFKETIDSQGTDMPSLLSLAITEPDAGTDSQNVEFLDMGTLGCHAKKVDGGYILNGTKIFISGAHLATWHMVYAYTDLKKASENMVMLAVKTGTKGFALGKKEKKMGQKGCPAGELVFNDCFIPDDHVCIDNSQVQNLSRGIRQTNEQVLAYIWGASRMGVGSFGTAAARGAFEEALRFASETEIDGTLLVNQTWCQCLLARMYQNVAVSRTAYVEAAYANSLHGMWKVMNQKPTYYLMKYTPRKLLIKLMGPLLKKPILTTLYRKICFDGQTEEEINRTDGWGSLAKVTGTDAAVENSRLALQLMGQAGIRHDRRIEKIMRDAKLLQIYEGTNQVNRINVFKRLIARNCPQVEVFSASNI